MVWTWGYQLFVWRDCLLRTWRLLLVTDVSTTCLVVSIFRVKWRWWYLCLWSWFGLGSFVMMWYIGCQNVKDVVIGRLFFCCYMYMYFRSAEVWRFHLRSFMSHLWGAGSCWHWFRGSRSEQEPQTMTPNINCNCELFIFTYNIYLSIIIIDKSILNGY